MSLRRQMTYFGVSCFSTGGFFVMIGWAITRGDIGDAIFNTAGLLFCILSVWINFALVGDK